MSEQDEITKQALTELQAWCDKYGAVISDDGVVEFEFTHSACSSSLPITSVNINLLNQGGRISFSDIEVSLGKGGEQ